MTNRRLPTIVAMINELVRRLTTIPGFIFILDAFGALVSMAFLLCFSGFLHTYIGLPVDVLHTLATIAGGLFGFSMMCYIYVSSAYHVFIRGLAIGNLLYCGITLWCIIQNYSSMTYLGLAYFGLELLVLCCLVSIEIYVAKKFQNT
ncbi:MAG: hypothetical protein WAU01_17745 [Saprospiraceae bacterium]